MSWMHWVVMGLPVAAITFAFFKTVHAFEEMRERAEAAEEALEDILVAQASIHHRKKLNVHDHEGRRPTATEAQGREHAQVPVAATRGG
jgi:hypothetical protein